MTKGNFKNVEDFIYPIIFVVFNNKFSSQIDEKDINLFINDLKNYLPNIQKGLLSQKDYFSIEKISKHNLISGMLFVNSVSGSNQIKYFPHASCSNRLSDSIIKTLENTH